MKKFKNVLLMSLAATTVLTTPIFAQENNSLSNDETIVTPYDMDITSGNISGTDYERTYYLNVMNGKSVNFYVENNGPEPVIIKINSKSRTLKSGESGHISEDVTGTNQKFTFSVSTGGNSGDIDINYIIRQKTN